MEQIEQKMEQLRQVIDLSDEKIELLQKYMKFFLEKNAVTNLISKNDAKLLFEKHIFDSLAIAKVIKPLKLKHDKQMRLLDIGTGGGFPAVPIAICYDSINVFALDSIRKKINIIEEIKQEFDLKNLFPICDRVENLNNKSNQKKYEHITSRAVAPLEVILKYAAPYLAPSGVFVAYKSKKVQEEIEQAQGALKLTKTKVVEVIQYDLPLPENFERNLVVIKKC